MTPLAKAGPPDNPSSLAAGACTGEHEAWRWLAWLLWILPALTIAALCAAMPFAHSVTPAYRAAAVNWLAHLPIYSGPAGFNYLPSFLMFYSLLSPLPAIAAEIVWRWIAFAGLGYGLWSWTRLFGTPHARHRNFVIATLLCLPIGISALRNGQSSAHLAACLVLGGAALQRHEWCKASLWLSLSLVCKPLGSVAIGLAFIVFPRTRIRLLAGTAVVLAAPFLFAPAHYVAGLYTAFFQNLASCFDTGTRSFADINGLLMPFGTTLRGLPSLGVRVFFALVFVGAGALVARRASDIRASLAWLTLTGSYLVLFTPMNEANSYVMLAPCLGLWACRYRESRRPGSATIIAAISLSLLLVPSVAGLYAGHDEGNQFAKFWNPLMTILLLAFLGTNMARYAHRSALSESSDDAVRQSPATRFEYPWHERPTK